MKKSSILILFVLLVAGAAAIFAADPPGLQRSGIGEAGRTPCAPTEELVALPAARFAATAADTADISAHNDPP